MNDSTYKNDSFFDILGLSEYETTQIKKVKICSLKPHYSLWISYCLYKLCPTLSKYDWFGLKSTLEGGYNPECYGYIILDEYDNYVLDGNHRIFLLKLKLNKNSYISIKLVKHKKLKTK